MVKETQEFADSPRGKFIQAQALYYGIKKLNEVEGVMREVSGYEQIFNQIEGTNI